MTDTFRHTFRLQARAAVKTDDGRSLIAGDTLNLSVRFDLPERVEEYIGQGLILVPSEVRYVDGLRRRIGAAWQVLTTGRLLVSML